MTNQIEQRISSREVAQMVEMEHSKLLRKIEDINKDFRKAEIGFSKYWIESTYKVEGNNKPYKEFQVTKRGCEFLAHKTFGTKGNLFTDRYMDKFEYMEKQLYSGQATKEIKPDLKEKEIQTRFNNSLARKANALLKIANDPLTTKERKKALLAQATEILTGSKEVKTLPHPIKKTYSATEIGKKLGISSNKVGRLANAHNLKTEEFGMVFKQTLEQNNKEVEDFRYYENVIPVLKELLNVQVKLDI